MVLLLISLANQLKKNAMKAKIPIYVGCCNSQLQLFVNSIFISVLTVVWQLYGASSSENCYWGLKRYGKKIVMSSLKVQVEGTYKKCNTLKKCGNLLKQQYVQLKFTYKFWLSAIPWRNLAKFNHNPLNKVFLLVLWLLEKWMVTLAQQNQRHEFSCPPNLSSSTWAATT